MAIGEIEVFDADAHVEEWDETFSDAYLPAALADRRPKVVLHGERLFWMVEDNALPKLYGRGCHVFGTPATYAGVVSVAAQMKLESIESQELREPAARLADMDREAIDYQVLYPTLFVAAYSLTSDPQLEVGLYQSYNNWMADKVRAGSGRLFWVAVITLTDVASAVAEVYRAKAMGAVGVMTLGTMRNQALDHPQFDPFFAALEATNLPVVIHVGWSAPGLNELFDTNFTSIAFPFRAQVQMAMIQMICGGTLDRHPDLTVGFFEVGVGWVPYWMEILDYYFAVKNRVPGLPFLEYRALHRPSDYLRRGQLYFGIEEAEYLMMPALKMIGDDFVVWASDIPHNDREPYAAVHIAEHAELSTIQKAKILGQNARRFYRL